MSWLRPRWKKVLRDMGQHKVRTFLTVSAIALGLLGAGSVLNTYTILRAALGEGYRATNPPSAVIHTSDIDEPLLGTLAALPSVAQIQAERHAGARVRIRGVWLPLQLFSMKDFAGHDIGLVEPESGEWPPRDGSLVIEQSSVSLARAGLGGTLDVEAAGGATMKLPITGVVRDSGLAPGWMEHVVYAFATPATLESLGIASSFDRLELVVAGNRLDEEHVRKVAFEVKARVESTGRLVSNVWIPTPGRHIHAAQMDSLLYVQGAFGLLALLCSCVLVINLMTAVLAGQVREIGVMKAVGASTGQIAGVYLALTAAMGLTASIVALPLALWMGRAYAAFAARLLNFDIQGYWPPLTVLLLQLAVGALLPMTAALLPIYRGARVTVSRAVRDYGISGDNFAAGTTGKLLSRVSGPGRPLLLSLRNTFRLRSRLILTLLTMAVGGAVFVGALNLRSSIQKTVAAMFYGLHYDLRLSFTEAQTFASLENAVRMASDVDGVEAWLGVRASLLEADGSYTDSFHLTGLPPATRLVSFPLEEGRWLRQGDRGAIVANRRLALQDSRFAVGRNVTLTIQGKVSEWQVVGLVSSSPTFPMAYVGREDLADRIGEPGRGHSVVVSVGSSDPVRQSEIFRTLERSLERSGFPVDSAQSIRRTRASMEDHFIMVANFLLGMAVLILIVGGFGLATTMSLAVLERTREIGVMRAIGASTGAIHRIVVIESLCLGVLAWLIALPLSVPISAVVGQGFAYIMFQGHIISAVNPWSYVIWAAVALLLSVLAGLYPAWNATRRTTAQALAYG